MTPSSGSPRSSRVVTRWVTLWFAPVSSDLFVLLRVAIGFVGLMTILSWLPVSLFWVPEGFMPVWGKGSFLRDPLIARGLGDAAGWLLFLGLVLSFTSMMAGFVTGWAIAACFGLSIVKAFWNPLPLSGAHDVLIVVLFCLLWADCSGAPSVDAWLRARRRHRGEEAAATQPIWPARLIQIHLAFIYFNSALWKLFGPTWRDGTSIHYVLNLNAYQRFPYSVPPSLDWLMTLSTYATLFWEATFWLMLFNRWSRRIAITVGVLMHLGLWIALELGSFSWVMLAVYIAFLPSPTASRVLDRWVRRQHHGAVGTPISGSAAEVSRSATEGLDPAV